MPLICPGVITPLVTLLVTQPTYLWLTGRPGCIVRNSCENYKSICCQGTSPVNRHCSDISTFYPTPLHPIQPAAPFHCLKWFVQVMTGTERTKCGLYRQWSIMVSCGQLLYATCPVEDRMGSQSSCQPLQETVWSLVVGQKSVNKKWGLNPITDCHLKTWAV